MLVDQYKSHCSVTDLCRWVDLPRNVYYYQPGTCQRGIKPSSYTLKTDGSLVENELVVEDIKYVLSDDFVCYGYKKVTYALRDLYYIINPKKVYRLMDE